MPYKDPEKYKQYQKSYQRNYSTKPEVKEKVKTRRAKTEIKARNKETLKKWLEKTKDKRRLAASVYYLANKEKITSRNNEWRFKNRYGITIQERDEMIVRQQGKCKICQEITKLHVDHNHTSGKVRGLLCHKCNSALGLLKENIELFQRAITYLQV